MEKLKRYNQIILAIGGTIVLIMVLIFGFVAGYELYDDIWGGSDDRADTRMIANDEVERLRADSLRKQVISFNTIMLIDTPGLKYLIPVGQATLEQVESLANSLDMKRSSGKRYEDSYRANTNNNLLLYESKTGTIQKIFNKRLSINSFNVEFKKSPSPVVFMDVTEDDSNKDGFLDQRDMEKLYYYRLHEKTLQEVAAPGKRFLRLIFNKDPNEILVQYGVDKDADGEFEETYEPKVFYRLRFADGSLSEIISQELITALQRQLDGN